MQSAHRFSVVVVAAFLALSVKPAAAFFRLQRQDAGQKPAGCPASQACVVQTGPGAPLPMADAARLMQTGHPAPTATKGFGHDIPLRIAGPLVLPRGWHWHAGPRAGSAPLSWRAGSPWIEALLNAPEPVHYTVDWADRSVAATWIGPWVPPKPVPPPLPTWRLVANRSLRAQISGWGRTAGWTVIWHGDRDIIVPSPVLFRGTFVDVLRNIVNDLQHEGVTVHAQIWSGNNTAVITIASSNGGAR